MRRRSAWAERKSVRLVTSSATRWGFAQCGFVAADIRRRSSCRGPGSAPPLASAAVAALETRVPVKPIPSFSPLALSGPLRRFLFITATLTGAVVLVVEILGAKMLTPWFGSSHFVWTAQITVTLLALAAGYYLGGWLADRTQKLAWIYGGLVVAAAYLALTVLVRTPLAAACLNLNLALGSIVASLLLFFVPLTLLAAVGPFFIRRLARTVEDVGGTVGRLSALGTVGSVLGVLVTSHVFVPYFRDSMALLGTAAVLVVLAAVYFVIWGIDEGGKGVATAAAAIGVLLAVNGVRREYEPAFKNFVEVERANSHFGMLQVLESKDGRRRLYLNDLLTQNTYYVPGRQSMSMFTYGLYHFLRGYTPSISNALCLGMGVGIVPRQFAADGVKVDVVEINPAILPIARKWFDFPADGIQVTIDDARHFLRVATNRYDAVQLDAFLGDSSPSHLMTREAFDEIRRVMNPDAALAINCFAHFEPGRDFFGASLQKTLASVFKSVVMHEAPGGNIFFVASDRAPLNFRPATRMDDMNPGLRQEVEAAIRNLKPVDTTRGIVLTDDYNPVDYFDAGNRERTRRNLTANLQYF